VCPSSSHKLQLLRHIDTFLELNWREESGKSEGKGLPERKRGSISTGLPSVDYLEVREPALGRTPTAVGLLISGIPRRP